MVHHLGMAQEECPFYTEKSRERAELFFARVMNEGASRKSIVIDVKDMPYIKRKWLTFQSRMKDSYLVRTYAPQYARHMIVGDLLHGLERLIKGK